MSTTLTGSDKYYPEVTTDKEFGGNDQIWSNTYSYGGADVKLELASRAMTALIATRDEKLYVNNGYLHCDSVAILAFDMADAMIKEYNNRSK